MHSNHAVNEYCARVFLWRSVLRKSILLYIVVFNSNRRARWFWALFCNEVTTGIFAYRFGHFIFSVSYSRSKVLLLFDYLEISFPLSSSLCFDIDLLYRARQPSIELLVLSSVKCFFDLVPSTHTFTIRTLYFTDFLSYAAPLLDSFQCNIMYWWGVLILCWWALEVYERTLDTYLFTIGIN